jgi:hypothetical protein
MSEGVQLVLWIAGVHLLGFIAVCVLLLPALRDDGGMDFNVDEGDDGWGHGPENRPTKPTPPGGGIPLPDAVPASVRLRDHDRLGDRLPSRERRPVREPAPERPVPVRTRTPGRRPLTR